MSGLVQNSSSAPCWFYELGRALSEDIDASDREWRREQHLIKLSSTWNEMLYNKGILFYACQSTSTIFYSIIVEKKILWKGNYHFQYFLFGYFSMIMKFFSNQKNGVTDRHFCLVVMELAVTHCVLVCSSCWQHYQTPGANGNVSCSSGKCKTLDICWMTI